MAFLYTGDIIIIIILLSLQHRMVFDFFSTFRQFHFQIAPLTAFCQAEGCGSLTLVSVEKCEKCDLSPSAKDSFLLAFLANMSVKAPISARKTEDLDLLRLSKMRRKRETVCMKHFTCTNSSTTFQKTEECTGRG